MSKKHSKEQQNTNFDDDEAGTIIKLSKDVGIGIDCHSQFIQVSVIVRVGNNHVEFQKSFSTDPKSIDKAREWAVHIISTKSDPRLTIDKDNLSYTIESTSTYHLPIVDRWGGNPEIINPKLTGSSRRKTDKLDATMLCLQNINGLWKSSYVPSKDIWALRSLIGQKESFGNSATKRSNQMNSLLLKFGITVGRDGSITKNKEVRSIVEDLISDSPSERIRKLYPEDLPIEVKAIIRESYKLYDNDRNSELKYLDLAIKKAESMQWETNDSTMSGKDMLQLLQTVPGVGISTALIWLSAVITPRRFPNTKALAAYCGLDPSLKISAKHVVSTVKRGGNEDLHKSLCFAASNLMKCRSEPLGLWGYKLYTASGKWKKGTNAVGRRISNILYSVMSTGLPFDYSKYTFFEFPDVIDISIQDLAAINSDFRRYIQPLYDAAILSTQTMVDKYHNGMLRKNKGLCGKKFQGLLKDFIQHQDRYETLYAEYNERRELILDAVSNHTLTIQELKDEYGQFKKYENALIKAGLKTNEDIVKAYYEGHLTNYSRLGAIFLAVVDDYISFEIKNVKKGNDK